MDDSLQDERRSACRGRGCTRPGELGTTLHAATVRPGPHTHWQPTLDWITGRRNAVLRGAGTATDDASLCATVKYASRRRVLDSSSRPFGIASPHAVCFPIPGFVTVIDAPCDSPPAHPLPAPAAFACRTSGAVASRAAALCPDTRVLHASYLSRHLPPRSIDRSHPVGVRHLQTHVYYGEHLGSFPTFTLR